ncbi:hypothetical protein B0H15DRAFT_956651 [Mycena belliarum]|uniref:F-box domain-containing protein n=1 Tax=Mycena belliarum TaxID=1033014 RepID=A0AAD6TSJ3_9AGAR|nr:hypothetical protein B0H15DRAFT_956651 [Mycena belliae]
MSDVGINEGVNDLEFGHAESQPQVAAQPNAPYPVLTLPPEIILEIFERFLPNYPGFPLVVGPRSPLLLCRICRQWRQIALSTPALWTSILIKNINSPDQLELLRAWLARSGDLPLSIGIVATNNGPRCTEILQAALAHCRRWEQAELIVPINIMPLLQAEMPLLRALTIGPVVVPVGGDGVVSVFEHAPQLKRLTHLDAVALYPHECAEILAEALNLVHCSFMVLMSTDEIPVLPAPIPLPYLRHLTLLSDLSDTSDGDFSYMDLLYNFTLPALHTLHLYEPFISTNPLLHLHEFIARSGCSLHELRLEGASWPLATYRASFPSIQTIVLPTPTAS